MNRGFVSAALLSIAISTPALAQMSVEDQIETRKAAYQFASWNMGKIKAQTVDGSVAFDPSQVAAAANAIAAVANSGMSTLYSRDSANDRLKTPASSRTSLKNRQKFGKSRSASSVKLTHCKKWLQPAIKAPLHASSPRLVKPAKPAIPTSGPNNPQDLPA